MASDKFVYIIKRKLHGGLKFISSRRHNVLYLFNSRLLGTCLVASIMSHPTHSRGIVVTFYTDKIQCAEHLRTFAKFLVKFFLRVLCYPQLVNKALVFAGLLMESRILMLLLML